MHPDLVFTRLFIPNISGRSRSALSSVVAIVIAGASNAVNLTDGLDGLAIGCHRHRRGRRSLCSPIVSSNYRWASYLEIQYIPRVGELTVFCGALVGASLGFLWYNAHPAEVFMAMLALFARWNARRHRCHHQARSTGSFFVGGVFVIEALSVIFQVGSFKCAENAFSAWRRFIIISNVGWSGVQSHRAFWIAAARLCAVCSDDAEVALKICRGGRFTGRPKHD